MSIEVLFFGATAEIVGRRHLTIEHAKGNLRKLVENVVSDHPSLASHKLVFSLNQQYSFGNEVLQDGDEVAIFTAVSGG